MYYAEIKPCDIANGTGVRVSLFVSGCTHHCKGCFNPQTWDFHFGNPFTEETEEQLLQALAPSHIQGLTLLGGEPFEPDNQRALLPFLRRVRKKYPDKTIWCYTGYLYDTELCAPSRARCEVTEEMLSLLDILVDGEFIEARKDIRLQFRGSSNQRILDLAKTRETGNLVLWEPRKIGAKMDER